MIPVVLGNQLRLRILCGGHGDVVDQAVFPDDDPAGMEAGMTY